LTYGLLFFFQLKNLEMDFEALAQDDIADKEEWFSFKKKDKTKLKTSTTEPERKDNDKDNIDVG